MLDYNNKPTRLHNSKSYNIYSDYSGKKSIYSFIAEWTSRPLRCVKSYITFAQKTRIFETLFDCLTIILMFGFFYLLFVFACAVDDQCAALHMIGGVQ